MEYNHAAYSFDGNSTFVCLVGTLPLNRQIFSQFLMPQSVDSCILILKVGIIQCRQLSIC